MTDRIEKIALFVGLNAAYIRGAFLSFAIVMSGAVASFAVEAIYLRLTTDAVPEGSLCWQITGFLISMTAFIIFAGMGLRAVGRQRTSTSITHFETYDTPDAKPEQRILRRSALIMGFSPLFSDEEKKSKTEGKSSPRLGEDGYKYKSLEDAISDTVPAREVFGNWQQPLRLIDRLTREPNKLKYVAILIGNQNQNTSDEDKEDIPYEHYKRFLNVLNNYFKKEKGVEFFAVQNSDNNGRFLISGGPTANNYNNPDFLKQGIAAAHDQLAKKLGNKSLHDSEKDIFIDVTAGQVTFSINAAAYSFNRDIEVVYIGTGCDSKNIYSFDTHLVIGSYQN